ncbi:MAG: hypothetical protein V3T86_17775 [Planctomycetota bacterium]
MRALLVLWLSTVALADAGITVEAPLGPYARPGVPLALRSTIDVTVSIDGWTYRLRDGEMTYVRVSRTPCAVVDASGAVLLELDAVPENTRLVLLLGAGPDNLAAGLKGADGEPVKAVHVREGDVPGLWNSLDLFDRVYLLQESRRDRALEKWGRGGGDVAGGGGDPKEVLARAGPVRPLRVARAASARPDLYKDLPPAEVAPDALDQARLVVLGSGIAFGLLILGGALFRVDRRLLLGMGALVGIAGAGLGAVLPERVDRPVAAGRIEEVFVLDGHVRRRIYRVAVTLRPGLAPMPGPGEQPVPFLERGGAWWESPGTAGSAEPGMTRIFVTEHVEPAGGPVDPTGEFRPPTNAPGEIRLCRRSAVALQD